MKIKITNDIELNFAHQILDWMANNLSKIDTDLLLELLVSISDYETMRAEASTVFTETELNSL